MLIPSLAKKSQDRVVVGICAGIVVCDALALHGPDVIILQERQQRRREANRAVAGGFPGSNIHFLRRYAEVNRLRLHRRKAGQQLCFLFITVIQHPGP